MKITVEIGEYYSFGNLGEGWGFRVCESGPLYMKCFMNAGLNAICLDTNSQNSARLTTFASDQKVIPYNIREIKISHR